MRQNLRLLTILMLFATHSFSQAPMFKWAKAMAGNQPALGYSIVTDNNGNVYTAGVFSGTVDFNPGPGTFYLTAGNSRSGFVSKLDSNGQFLWAKSIISSCFFTCSGTYGIATDNLGNAYVTGAFSETTDFDPGSGAHILPRDEGGPFVLKLGPAGNFLWVRSFKGVYPFASHGYAITADAAGNTYTTGMFGQTVDFDPGPGVYMLESNGPTPDAFVVKLDASGNFVWAKKTGTTRLELPYAICLDNHGNLYTTGRFGGSGYSPDPNFTALGFSFPAEHDSVFVWKMDNSGNTQWTKFFRNDSSSESKDVFVDADGHIYTTGRFYGTIDFDPGPATYNLTSLGVADVFISKLDANGNFVWVKRLPSSPTWSYIWSNSESLVVDKAGNIYLIGTLAGYLDFDPGNGINMLTASGYWDIFLLKLDASGNFLWASQIGNTGYDYGLDLAIDQKNNIYATGGFSGTVDFDPGAAVFNMTTPLSAMGMYALKLKDTTSIQWPVSPCRISEATKIYPNPCSRSLFINKERTTCTVTMNVYDILGRRVVRNKLLQDGLNELPVFGLPAGTYFYEFISGGGTLLTGKFVKS